MNGATHTINNIWFIDLNVENNGDDFVGLNESVILYVEPNAFKREELVNEKRTDQHKGCALDNSVVFRRGCHQLIN